MFDKKCKSRCMKQRIILCITFCSLLIVMISQIASAHSPSGMELSYNVETQLLEVTITHQVSNPESHYVYNIVIDKNGEIYDSLNYNSQPSSSSFTYNFEVNTSEDDVVKVTANCNQVGSVTKQLTVTSDGVIVENGKDDNGIPGFELVIIISAMLILIILIRNKRV